MIDEEQLLLLREEFLSYIKECNNKLNIEMIGHAYDVAMKAHSGQKRKSGEPYLIHCVETAKILAELGLNSSIISGGLLHDTVEDGGCTLEYIEREFGGQIASLVDGVTKIASFRGTLAEQKQAENLHKLVISTAHNPAVMFIKLADRLHNMRTIEYHTNPEKISRIAKETREIYVPIAYKIGLAKIREELEDLTLKYMEPGFYNEIYKKIQETSQIQNEFFVFAKNAFENEFRKGNIYPEIISKNEHIYSIYRKVTGQKIPLERVFDTIGVIVLADTREDCYRLFGIIHSIWTPISEKFHDYIASPKSNGYKSIHTAVIALRGKIAKVIEVYIRTKEMQEIAEKGNILINYQSEEAMPSNVYNEQKNIMAQILEYTDDEDMDYLDFMQTLRDSLSEDEITVLTPKGDRINLPVDSTALDFAFAVHTELGLYCKRVKINNILSPIRTKLKNWDIVEVIVSDNIQVTEEWLKWVKTPKARNKIRQVIKQTEKENWTKFGKEIIVKELENRKIDLSVLNSIPELALRLGYLNENELYKAIGHGDESPLKVLSHIFPEHHKKESITNKILHILPWVSSQNESNHKIRVDNVEEISKTFAKCCNPVAGEEIIGYLSKGRGIIVHTADCPNIKSIEPDRKIKLIWDKEKLANEKNKSFEVKLTIIGEDRVGLLADITKTISETATNIRENTLSTHDGWAEGYFTIEVYNIQHLRKVIDKIKKIQGIRSVERTRTA